MADRRPAEEYAEPAGWPTDVHGDPLTYCCADMRGRCEESCDDHGRECVDIVMTRFKSGMFGIPIHDGGASIIQVTFCPWCGRRLPTPTHTSQEADRG